MLETISESRVYRIVREIASGGMGTVYEAAQQGVEGFEKRVAIKVLNATLSSSRRFTDMFVREGKLVATLVHENIVQIYQLGEYNGEFYIVMELVHGLSLSDLLAHHKARKLSLPISLAVFIASRVARGLAYAHSKCNEFGEPLGIVHRDVGPKNILITTEGLAKLCDFGLAFVTNDPQAETARLLVGKLPYMPPEQALITPIDYRADIFSLGATLFEMLTGRLIRSGKTKDEFREKAKAGVIDWTPLEQLAEKLPPALDAIVRKCLAVDREQRYAKTEEAARDLEYFIYKDGYGPTIQTLEAYLRSHFPSLYEPRLRAS